jgi:hypothetical protein
MGVDGQGSTGQFCTAPVDGQGSTEQFCAAPVFSHGRSFLTVGTTLRSYLDLDAPDHSDQDSDSDG